MFWQHCANNLFYLITLEKTNCVFDINIYWRFSDGILKQFIIHHLDRQISTKLKVLWISHGSIVSCGQWCRHTLAFLWFISLEVLWNFPRITIKSNKGIWFANARKYLKFLWFSKWRNFEDKLELALIAFWVKFEPKKIFF